MFLSNSDYFILVFIVLCNLFSVIFLFLSGNERKLTRWFALAFIMLCMSLIIVFFLHTGLIVNSQYLFAVICGMFVILILYLLRDMVFRSKAIFEKKVPEDEKGEAEVAEKPEKKNPLRNLTKKQVSQMKYEVDLLLQRSQPYLKHGYSIKEMSNSLSYPIYLLSALINSEYGMHFNELINQYRIAHAEKLIRESGASLPGIKDIADRCGFNNRNSFTSAFKKFTGKTPSEYFKAQRTFD